MTDRDIDRLSAAYLTALDRGDFDALDRIWDHAATKPQLEEALHELHVTLTREQIMTSEASRFIKRFSLPLPLGIGLLFLVAGVATWWLVPPLHYAARTQLHVTVDPPNPLFPEKSGVNHEVFMRNQAYLIRDRFVLNAALRDNPNIAELSLIKDQSDPLQWLEKEIRVEFPSPSFIHISLSGEQPEELAKIVTAVTESYLENVVDREGKTRRDELQKLKQIHDDFLKRTKTKRERIRNLQRNVGSIDEKNLVIQQQIDLENLRIVKNELAKVHSDLRNLRVELGLHPDWVGEVWPMYVVALNALPGSGLPINHAVVTLLHDDAFIAMASSAAQNLDELINKDQTIEGLKREITLLQGRLVKMIAASQADEFKKQVVSILELLAEKEKTLEARRNELRPMIFEKHRHLLQQAAQGDRLQKQDKLRLLEVMKRALLKEATDLDKKLQQTRRDAADLVEEKVELDREEGIWQKAYERILKMELEQDVPARVTPTDKDRDGRPQVKAVVSTPNKTKRKVMMTSGTALIGLALLLLVLAWFQYSSQNPYVMLVLAWFQYPSQNPYVIEEEIEEEDSPTLSSSE
jgi:hypothetical protein